MKALTYDTGPVGWTIRKAAGFVTNRAYYGVLSGLRLVERPTPALPGAGWVRLKTILGGVCGTDLALVAQRNHPATILQSFARFPAVLGHENLAVIDEVGGDVGDWQAGQRVCVEPATGCLARDVTTPCDQCAAGRTSLCEHTGDDRLPPRALIGLNSLTGGSWAGYFVAHASQLHAVPDAVQDDVAILIDPIASAAHAVLRRPPRLGERVLVVGSGIVAFGVIAFVRALKCDNAITVIARHAFQADLARRLGATSVIEHPRGGDNAERYDAVAAAVGGRRIPARFGNQAMLGGFDLTYAVTASGSGMTDALKWTRSRGVVVAVGTSGITLLDTTPVWFDELEVVGANGRQIEEVEGRRVHTYDLVAEWIAEGRLDLSPIPVSRYRLSDYRTAFAHLLSRGRHPIVKAVFDPS